jgi:hypothetical protein
MNKLLLVAALLSASSAFALDLRFLFPSAPQGNPVPPAAINPYRPTPIPNAMPTVAVSADQAARIMAGMDSQWRGEGVVLDWNANYPWSRVSTEQRRVINDFSKTHLAEAYENTKTVFYPFGGPDVIFPSLFFPNMKTLILAGLENPGSLPKDAVSAQQKIEEVRRAYRAVFTYGYYITSKMSSELREFGTTTMISVGLVVLGNKILSVESAGIPRSVRIVYQTPDNDVRQVLYVQQNLDDQHIAPAFVDLVQNLKIDTTFYKASSYVPQIPGFTKVNGLALGGRYFVQSDTGLTIKTFAEAGHWNVHLFGQYVPPAHIFGVSVQPGLAWAYANSICKSNDAVAIYQFKAIWGTKDPCSVRNTEEGSISNYDGPLAFQYDYAGKLSPHTIRGFSSNLIYAVRK